MSSQIADTSEIAQQGAAAVAKSLRRDFIALMAIFDRQLMNGAAPSDMAGCKIPAARAAAERGVQLADELVDLLRR